MRKRVLERIGMWLFPLVIEHVNRGVKWTSWAEFVDLGMSILVELIDVWVGYWPVQKLLGLKWESRSNPIRQFLLCFNCFIFFQKKSLLWLYNISNKRSVFENILTTFLMNQFGLDNYPKYDVLKCWVVVQNIDFLNSMKSVGGKPKYRLFWTQWKTT